MKISEKIKKLRIENNLSQNDLARALNVTRVAVSKWELGKSLPTIDNLRLIANLFNVQLSDLVDEKENNEVMNVENEEKCEDNTTSSDAIPVKATKEKKENIFKRIYGNVSKGWIIGRSLSLVGIAVLIAGVNIGTKYANDYGSQLTAYLCPPITDESKVNEVLTAGKDFSKKITLEGAALLKNDNNVLPLSKVDDKKVNVFGYGSVDWSYGGIGNGCSGQVRPENNDPNSVVDLMKALKRYGIQTNTTIQDFYRSWCEPVNLIDNPNEIDRNFASTLREPPISAYSSELLENAKEYSNVAIAVLSRTCFENIDLPNTQRKAGPGMSEDNTRHYLEISTEEQEMLTYLGENFEKVIVIVNAGNMMELSFMKTIPGLDACVYTGTTGTQAAESIPNLLWGDTAFSGKLVDTIPYSFDYSTASYSTWFGSGTYADGSHGLEYIEGIYVGYKWFETADYEGVYNNVDNTSLYGEGATGYDGIVQYPFGYGLSYTTFDWKIVKTEPEINSSIDDNTQFSIDVEVTNTGSYEGKDIVEAYITLPYSKGGIEKSYVSLVGYAKTDNLIPGASQVVTIDIDANDFLSYDCYDKNNNGFKGYELEKGDYQIKLMTDSHNIKQIDGNDAILTYKVEETIKVENDKYTGTAVKNLFTGDDAIDGFSIDGLKEGNEIPYMSRNDFATGYEIPTRTNEFKKRSLYDEQIKQLVYTSEKAKAWDEATVDVFGNSVVQSKPTWGANNGKKVANESGIPTELGLALGKDYNDPQWEDVLDQVTYNEAINLMSKSPSGNKEIASIGKPRLLCYDSMIQIKGFAGTPRGTGNPTTIILAMSWNNKLAYEYATNFANEMKTIGVQGVFGPGINLHRSAFGGRNFEYFSEDSYLTGEIACIIVRGLQNYGRSVEMKHFVLNEQESWRYGCVTMLSEQALRETYLRPFQRVTQETNLSGIMTAFNRIGTQWVGGSQALLDGVLRNEWGFKGYVDTDWTTGIIGTPDEQLRAGGEIGMAQALGESISYDYSQGATTGRFQRRLRQAVKNVLYGWLSPKYQESIYVPSADEKVSTSFTIQSWQWWQPALVGINCLVYFGSTIWLVCLFVPTKKTNLNNENEGNDKENN